MSFSAPQSAFWAASAHMQKRGLPGYRLETASLGGGLVPTAEGMMIETAPLSDFDDCEIDTLILPGSPDLDLELESTRALVKWLRTASKRARRTAAVCTGAFFLAQAGLLDNKRVTTHWKQRERLQRCFPALQIDEEALFVQHDDIWTSAGFSAGIDFTLAMIEEDYGRNAAVHIAQKLAVFLRRPGSQPQLSELLLSQTADVDPFDSLHLWLKENLHMEHLVIHTLAERVNMSPRNFSRAYKRKTGQTPGRTLELLRLEAAQRLLENSSCEPEQIARQCGFAREDKLLEVFQRHLGISPSDYRQRFHAAGMLDEPRVLPALPTPPTLKAA